MYSREPSETLRARICPRCRKQFFICRSCDRGHVYCCKSCSEISRCLNLRTYRKRHRRNVYGRMNHQDSERRRRQRQKSVGDHTSQTPSQTVNLSAQTRMAAVFAALKDVCGKDSVNGKYRCEWCGRRSNFAEFTDFGEANKQRGSGYRLRM